MCYTSWHWPIFSKSKFLEIYNMKYLENSGNYRKMLKYDFYRGWYCKCCTSWQPKFSRSRIKKCEYLANDENKQKMLAPTFIEIDICHRMEPLRVLCFMTLTYIFKVILFKWLFEKAGKMQTLLLPSYWMASLRWSTSSPWSTFSRSLILKFDIS